MTDILRLIVGRAKTGKSYAIRKMIADLNPERSILIVPPQYTFENERELSDLLGGLYSVEVFSFESLSARVLKEVGERREFLSKQGKLMVIRSILEKTDLKLFKGVAKTRGFTKQCGNLFTHFKAFNITPDDLDSVVPELSTNPILSEKLTEISLIYRSVENYLSLHLLDSMDAFLALEKGIEKSSFSGAHVFLDGLDTFNERIYGIINALMKSAKTLTVSIRMDTSAAPRDGRVFLNQRDFFLRLLKMAKENGIKCAVKTLSENAGYFNDPALSFVESELFSHPFSAFSGEALPLTLFAGTDRTAEVERAAAEISRLARSGLQYKEIAVVASDYAAYSHIVRRIFRKNGIPVFMDVQHPLFQKNEVVFIMSAIDSCLYGFRQNDVFALIKTGLTDVSPDDAELLENYMLQFGIGGNAMTEPFFKGAPDSLLENARKTLMIPLIELQKGLKVRLVSEKSAALFAYLKKLRLRERSQENADRLGREKRFELMEECAQVYNTIAEMFDQLNAIMGETELSLARYREVVLEGFFAYNVGVIPATIDNVIVGSVERTKLSKIKALFILGVNEGLLPKTLTDDSMIDDSEIAALANAGLSVWGGTDTLIIKNLFDIYGLITRPSDLLSISYALTINGKASSPSSIVSRLKNIFPKLNEDSDLIPHDYAKNENAGSALIMLSRGLRRFIDSRREDCNLKNLYAWYIKSPIYRSRLALIRNALYPEISPSPIDEEFSRALYGGVRAGSASELETFNSCPFKHFVRYALSPKLKKEYKEKSIDRGTLFHDCLDRFLKKIMEDKIDIKTITREISDKIVSLVLEDAVAIHNDGVLNDTARGRAQLSIMSGAIRDTAFALIKQLNAGKFSVLATEVVFGAAGSLPPIKIDIGNGNTFYLSGKIDRVDCFSGRRGQYIRVIDYKSGGLSFDFSDLFNGVRLQLPLYIAAYIASNNLNKPGGFYYLPIHEPILKESDLEKTDVLNAIEKQFRLSGLTLKDPELIDATDSSFERFSNVVSLQKTKDGFSGKALDECEMNAVIGYTLEKAKNTTDEILSGKNAVSPYKSGNRTACDICDYKSICRFDARTDSEAFRRARKLSERDFFEFLGIT
ncbi:MAG: PD-(D/E)XK nuclease family protein [Clostridia bacterium]